VGSMTTDDTRSSRARAPSDSFEELRAREYSRLDRAGQVYLDHTGGGLYAESQVREHGALLTRGVFGNPHSLNPTSLAATELVERARQCVLRFFGAAADEYLVIFTLNASSALKLVGEAYPFSGGRLLLTYDNHNSVNGLREFARACGAPFRYLPLARPELRVEEETLVAELDRGRRGHRLFAFPAQSNFSGVHHPLSFIDQAQRRGWDVLLDAATFVPTNRLDLGRWHPDFVALSFYKMFGFPTGVGCLLARRRALAKLRRPWFAGGTVWGVSVASDFHYLLEGAAAFEDGTLDYLGIPAVEIGLRHLGAVGIDRVHAHVMRLTALLFERLLPLRHGTGQPLVEIYGPPHCAGRGASVALNFLDPDGRVVDERVVERTAQARRISLRTGCFCNPGGFEAAWNLTRQDYRVFRPRGWKLVRALLAGPPPHPTMDEYLARLGLPNAGAVRVSFGVASSVGDVETFVDYARSFLDVAPDATNLRARVGC
jgi:molybdenum cofactor sulfurtransferase